MTMIPSKELIKWIDKRCNLKPNAPDNIVDEYKAFIGAVNHNSAPILAHSGEQKESTNA